MAPGERTVRANRPPTEHSLRDVGSTFHNAHLSFPGAIASAESRITWFGSKTALLRLIERATSSNWRPTVCSSKTFVVSRSLMDWSDTRIAASVSITPRRYVQACLRFLTKSERPNAVGNATSTTINPANAGLAVSVLFAERV